MRPWDAIEAISRIEDDKLAKAELARWVRTLTPVGEAWRVLPGWVPGMAGIYDGREV